MAEDTASKWWEEQKDKRKTQRLQNKANRLAKIIETPKRAPRKTMHRSDFLALLRQLDK